MSCYQIVNTMRTFDTIATSQHYSMDSRPGNNSRNRESGINIGEQVTKIIFAYIMRQRRAKELIHRRALQDGKKENLNTNKQSIFIRMID